MGDDVRYCVIEGCGRETHPMMATCGRTYCCGEFFSRWEGRLGDVRRFIFTRELPGPVLSERDVDDIIAMRRRWLGKDRAQSAPAQDTPRAGGPFCCICGGAIAGTVTCSQACLDAWWTAADRMWPGDLGDVPLITLVRDATLPLPTDPAAAAFVTACRRRRAGLPAEREPNQTPASPVPPPTPTVRAVAVTYTLGEAIVALDAVFADWARTAWRHGGDARRARERDVIDACEAGRHAAHELRAALADVEHMTATLFDTSTPRQLAHTLGWKITFDAPLNSRAWRCLAEIAAACAVIAGRT